MMFNLFSKEKLKPNVFFHIPKTGGSTFIGAVKDQYNKTDKTPTHLVKSIADFQIFHVDFKEKERRFEGRKIIRRISEYKKVNFFILFREPSKRLRSEFNFQFHILDGKSGNPNAAILNKIKKKPTNFFQYINAPETQNYQTKFLLGKPIGYAGNIDELEFKKLLENLNAPNIFLGITKEYIKFLKIFCEKSSMNLPQKVIIRKKTPKNYLSDINYDEELRIKERNNFDVRLYEFVKSKTESFTQNLNKDFQLINPNKFEI